MDPKVQWNLGQRFGSFDPVSTRGLAVPLRGVTSALRTRKKEKKRGRRLLTEKRLVHLQLGNPTKAVGQSPFLVGRCTTHVSLF